MKKTIITGLALISMAVASFGQGVIYFDGSNNSSTSVNATTEGSVFLNGVLDTTTDINACLLYSTTLAGTYSPIATLLLAASTTTVTTATGSTQPASGDITFFGSGSVFDNSGNSYAISGIAAGTTVYFILEGWTGNYTSYAEALASGNVSVLAGATSAFTETLTSATGTANDIQNASALNLIPVTVPEPCTMALLGLGGLSLLMIRRRK
jgi:uncharacterized membrane protein